MQELESRIKNIKIQVDASVIDALRQMDRVNRKLLLVFNNDLFVNVLSIGDIQRGILKKFPLSVKIKEVLRDKTKIAKEAESFDSIKKVMEKNRIECMPVVDDLGNLVNVYFWEDVFGKAKKRIHSALGIPVIIMAGGKGTRLKPLTNVIPKPLIPIEENTIIEEIINRFVEVGCDNFYLSVNYKAEMIKYFFEQIADKNYSIDYFQETQPLGTAGSLFLIKNKINTTFFVSNCDIIINENYAEILRYHKENNNELTIVSALKHYPIPYGTIETAKDGILTDLVEKPELTFQINTGMYILEPHLLDEIPENIFFHITHLIENIIKRNGKVGVFPISEGSWIDIGNWSDYLKIMK